MNTGPCPAQVGTLQRIQDPGTKAVLAASLAPGALPPCLRSPWQAATS